MGLSQIFNDPPKPSKERVDFLGIKRGSGQVIASADDGVGTRRMWKVLCGCGVTFEASGARLRQRKSFTCPSCNIESKLKHGMAKRGDLHWLYRTWDDMKRRCHDPRFSSYEYYGARGIFVYRPWRKNFDDFERYVRLQLGPKPTAKHSIDRIDPEGGYRPGNIRWASPKEQAANKRPKNRIS